MKENIIFQCHQVLPPSITTCFSKMPHWGFHSLLWSAFSDRMVLMLAHILTISEQLHDSVLPAIPPPRSSTSWFAPNLLSLAKPSLLPTTQLKLWLTGFKEV